MKSIKEKAYLSPFSDSHWLKKIAILSIINFFALFLLKAQLNPGYMLICCIISLFLSFLVTGYLVKFIHNEINNNCPILPEWNEILDFFKKGFIFSLIGFIWLLPLAVLIISEMVLIKLLILKNILLLISMIFLLLIALFLAISLGFVICMYADKYLFKDAFNFKRLSHIILAVKKEMFMIILALIIVSGFNSLINKVSGINIIITYMCSIIYSIIPLILYNMYAQVYKLAKFRLNEITKNELTKQIET